MRTFIIIVVLLFTAGCTSQKSAETGSASAESATTSQPTETVESAPTSTKTVDKSFDEPEFGEPVRTGSDDYAAQMGLKKALFAGGCFWCMEPPFDKLDGVKATVSGYAGGTETKPEYKEVARGKTSHTEAVLVIYDPNSITYGQLLDAFWKSHDPTDADGQFVDRGSQYRPAVFYYDDAQRQAAQESAKKLAASEKFDEPIATEISAATDFWPAEEYHQDFYKKDPSHYKRYLRGSGRTQFLDRIWGD